MPFFSFFCNKYLTNGLSFVIIIWLSNGRLAQLGEHLPYKQRVTGSSPVLSTRTCNSEFIYGFGLVAQLVRALACHARGRGFEPHPSRQFAQLSSRLEQSDNKLNTCGFSSFGRAPPCQGGGGGFEPRNPLHEKRHSHRVSFCFYLYPGLRSRQYF